MPRKSTVRRLPRELRDQIGKLLDDGRTLDEIKAHLDQLGADVSRSALGRYKKQHDQVAERVRRSREVAEALVRNLGDEPESKTTRLNVELMHSVILDLIMQVPGPDEAPDNEGEQAARVELNPMGVMLMAKALDHLAKAKRSDADLIAKLREQARKEAAEVVDAAAKKHGASAKFRRAMRAELGIPA